MLMRLEDVDIEEFVGKKRSEIRDIIMNMPISDDNAEQLCGLLVDLKICKSYPLGVFDLVNIAVRNEADAEIAGMITNKATELTNEHR